MSQISGHGSETGSLLHSLGLAAALALAGLGFVAASPAQAALITPNGWQAGCQFKTIPGSGGEGLRYDACMRLQTCQRLADSAGTTIFGAGCFGVAPDASAQPSARYSAH